MDLESATFSCHEEFCEYAGRFKVLYYFIGDGPPPSDWVAALGSQRLQEDEAAVLLDVRHDGGFLRDTQKTIDLRAGTTAPLSSFRGLGAWAGTGVDFITDPGSVPDLMREARRWGQGRVPAPARRGAPTARPNSDRSGRHVDRLARAVLRARENPPQLP